MYSAMKRMKVNKTISLLKKPKLRNPSFVAAWPGMGSVATTAVNYLKDQLKAKSLGEIVKSEFFAPTGASVAKQIIQAPESPTNQFYYHESTSSSQDLLIFLGSVQPIPHREYEFAKQILQVAQSFGVQQIFTCAAAPSDMHFKDAPRVFAAPNDEGLLKELLEYKVHFMGEGTIAGLNGLLVAVAAEMGMKGTCLLGEIPFFTAQIEFPRASLRVLEILSKLLHIRLDMMDLELYAENKEKEIEPLASMLSKHKTDTETPQPEQNIVPEAEEKIPRAVRLTIEKLFRQAEFDRTYKSKMRLKEELDKWELFKDYEDRFLDLFKKDS